MRGAEDVGHVGQATECPVRGAVQVVGQDPGPHPKLLPELPGVIELALERIMVGEVLSGMSPTDVQKDRLNVARRVLSVEFLHGWTRHPAVRSSQEPSSTTVSPNCLRKPQLFSDSLPHSWHLLASRFHAPENDRNRPQQAGFEFRLALRCLLKSPWRAIVDTFRTLLLASRLEGQAVAMAAGLASLAALVAKFDRRWRPARASHRSWGSSRPRDLSPPHAACPSTPDGWAGHLTALSTTTAPATGRKCPETYASEEVAARLFADLLRDSAPLP